MNYKDVGIRETEYKAILERLGREPSETELRLFGVMWSEHCSYKSTRPLLGLFPSKGARAMGGAGENAGMVELDEKHALAFKIESHNHPCAVEPYQGAATGVGGILRDILAMGAYPIATMNALFFGADKGPNTMRIRRGVVEGVGGYGNCVGMPTVGGKTMYSACYEENPLLNAFCAGIVEKSKIVSSRTARPGQKLLILGGPTGRDGIAGAAFASAEFDEDMEAKRPNIQIGDPFAGKKLIECVMELLDKELVACMQDMGAAGVVSSTSEVAAKSGVGMTIHLDKAHTRSAGMKGWEIALSETQERMLLVVDEKQLPEVRRIAAKWLMDLSEIGITTGDGRYVMLDEGAVVADLPPDFIGGDAPVIPWVSRAPEDLATRQAQPVLATPSDYGQLLLRLLSAPDQSEKSAIWEQYDSMVQLRTVAGPGAPAAVLRAFPAKGLIAFALDADPYKCLTDPIRGAAEVTARTIRALAVTGAEALGLTNCLNFPSPEKPGQFFELEQCIKGIAQAAEALEAPVVSGNVSLYNEGVRGRILPSPVLVAVGAIADENGYLPAGRAQEGDLLFLAGTAEGAMGASRFQLLDNPKPQGNTVAFNAAAEKQFVQCALNTAHKKAASSGRAIAGGGLLAALAVEAIQSGVGFQAHCPATLRELELWLGEGGPRAIYAVPAEKADAFRGIWQNNCWELGRFSGSQLQIDGKMDITLDAAENAWRQTCKH